MNEELDYPEQVPFVFANGDWIPLSRTKFLNIEEGIYGEDIVTFRYKNKIYQSKIILKCL